MDKQIEIYDKHVAFWGSELSNFYPCNFELYGHTWKSSEQCFMAEKARFFGDESTYNEILNTKTPKEAKKLGRKVKNFSDERWEKVRETIMYNIVYEKFSQNKNLREILLSKDFENKKFIEGSPYDGIWGVKISWDDPKIDNEKNWNGLNLLGKVLDKVRFNLKH